MTSMISPRVSVSLKYLFFYLRNTSVAPDHDFDVNSAGTETSNEQFDMRLMNQVH